MCCRLIIPGVDLPTISGFDTCQCLRFNPDTAHIPVILFLHPDRPVEALDGLELGIIDYISNNTFAQPTLVNTIGQLNQGDHP